jgi:hypothetical protein
MTKNKILSTLNAALTVTNLYGGLEASVLEGIPLGTVDGTATGELIVKVKVLNASDITIGAVTQSGTWTVQPGNTPNTVPWLFTPSVGAALGASIVASVAQEASHVIKGSAGTLLSLVGYNAGPDQFIQIHNTTTVPVNTAVPIYSIKVAAGTNFTLDVPISGMPFTTGISVCNSTTQATKTLGSTDCWFTAVIK